MRSRTGEMFHFKKGSLMRVFTLCRECRIVLSCLYATYEATARRLLALLSIKTGNCVRWNLLRLATFVPASCFSLFPVFMLS